MLNLRENIQLAINGLIANKMRALLTMLGIIIGISSVITIVTIGTAVSNSIMGVFNDMGANSIQFMLRDKPDENGNFDYTRSYEDEDYITDEMISGYRERFAEDIYAWAVQVNLGNGQIQNGRKQFDVSVVGANADALRIQNIDVVAGHDLSEREVAGNKRVAVVSIQFLEKLFPGVSPQEALGREVKLRTATGQNTFSIVGAYNYEIKGLMAGMAGDTTGMMIIPIGVAQEISNNDQDGYYWMQVRANADVDVEEFAQQSIDFLNETYYRSNKYVEIQYQNMDSMIGQMTGMISMVQLAISVIAAISLLVGGIGVMNIMLVSVTERTREIGTRKALGAKNSAIRIQFIVESMIICLIGGALGVLLGTTVGRIGSIALQAPAWPSVSIVVIAVLFSMSIGVFFGFYPANKAAKLDPIEALRYE